MTDPPDRIVVGITGASGAAYARRVIELLAKAGTEVHLTVSRLGRRLLVDELGMTRIDPDAISGDRGERVVVHRNSDLGAPIASGSFLCRGMIVVPASSNTLSAIATGRTENLVQRAAAVTLKERRPLIIAHRETPLSHVDIVNMERVSSAGATLLPLAPGFYLHPTSVGDLVDFMAARALDLLGVDHHLDLRWPGQD